MNLNRSLQLLLASCLMATPLSASEECEFEDGYNPSYFDNDCSWGFYAEADYLLWFAKQAGLSFATKPSISQTSGDFPVVVVEQDYYLPDYKWKSGVRASLGVRPIGLTWDMRLTYTYFQDKLKAPLIEGSIGSDVVTLVFTDFLTNFGNTNFIYSNQTHWSLEYNQADFELGREFFTNWDASFRPFIGLREIETKQHLVETIQSIIPGNDSFIPTLEFLHSRTLFEGLGIKAGFDSALTLGYGFDLYGNFTGGLVWGRFKIDETLMINGINPDDGSEFPFLDENLTRRFLSTTFSADLAIGISWNYYLMQNSRLTLKFGWEQHLLTNMNQFQNYIVEDVATNQSDQSFTLDRNRQRGDLSLQGFVLSASLSF